MTSVPRKLPVVVPLVFLSLAGIVCVGICNSTSDGPKKSVGTLVFEARKAGDFNIDSLATIREMAAKSGKDFQIVAKRPPIKWQWPPWKTLETYRDDFRGYSSLWELRVFDIEPDVAVNTANMIAVQTQEFCAKQFDVCYEAWLKTLSPARYHEERMIPGCFSYEGIYIWEAAATSKPRTNTFLDSLSRTLIDGLIL